MDIDLRKKAEETSFLCYVDVQGRHADFLALRKTFITNLSKSGVSPKIAQSFARHSDINLTMNVYTDIVLEDQAVAVESLPELPTLVPSPTSFKPPCIHQHLAKIRERATRKTAGKNSRSSVSRVTRTSPKKSRGTEDRRENTWPSLKTANQLICDRNWRVLAHICPESRDNLQGKPRTDVIARWPTAFNGSVTVDVGYTRTRAAFSLCDTASRIKAITGN